MKSSSYQFAVHSKSRACVLAIINEESVYRIVKDLLLPMQRLSKYRVYQIWALLLNG
jgi:hypothetical protein